MHILNYLNAEATKLWAERAEAQARGWRRAGYVLLALLAIQTWLVVDTAMTLIEQRRTSALTVDFLREELAGVQEERNALRVDLTDAEKFYEGEQSEIYVALQRAVDAEEAADAAKAKFAVCLSANAGLVEVLHQFDRTVKDQQVLIDDAVELAKRCDARPALWVAREPAVSEVTW